MAKGGGTRIEPTFEGDATPNARAPSVERPVSARKRSEGVLRDALGWGAAVFSHISLCVIIGAGPFLAENNRSLSEHVADVPANNLLDGRAAVNAHRRRDGKAFYYAVADGKRDRRNTGEVIWSQVPGENHPALRATLFIPEQNATIVLTISANSDAAIPASHLIEIQFLAQVGSSAIQDVPALITKQSETMPGRPLTGVSVRVTDGVFWIALSEDDEVRAQNIQLLRGSSWLEIPIVFGDQSRGAIVFEKGESGRIAMNTAAANWK